MNEPEPAPGRFSRRRFLWIGGGLVAAGAAGGVIASLDSSSETPEDNGAVPRAGELEPGHQHSEEAEQDGRSSPARVRHWSDPETWPGNVVPGADDIATVSGRVLLDVDAQVAGAFIEPEGELLFDQHASRSLASTGNVVVSGRLEMRPADQSIVHRITFVDVDESRFVGGGHEVLDSDVGLWVIGSGVVDAIGSEKLAWTRVVADVARGDAELDLGEEPRGWTSGDSVVVTPTAPTTVDTWFDTYDSGSLDRVEGTHVALSSAFRYNHPLVEPRPETVHGAEVLNLSRNVLIEGAPDARAHVMIMSSAPQTFRYVELRHLGPRREGEKVAGRYALHFHMAGDGARGSVVEGVAAHDIGNHTFVPHLSHGIVFRNCISHDTLEDAYWWDPAQSDEDRDSIPSNDILYERCVASRVRTTNEAQGRFTLTGFWMGAGVGNVADGCVAVGVQGNAESASGYHWPSHSRMDGAVWQFADCVAHNCAESGIYFWQNTGNSHVVSHFTCYYATSGILAGSYANRNRYESCTVYACRKVGISLGAVPIRAGQIEVVDTYVDQAGLSDFAMEAGPHIARPAAPTVVERCHLRGGTRAQFGVGGSEEHLQLYDLVACTFEGNELWLGADIASDSVVRLDQSSQTVLVRPLGHSGQPRPEWNAVVSNA